MYLKKLDKSAIACSVIMIVFFFCYVSECYFVYEIHKKCTKKKIH